MGNETFGKLEVYTEEQDGKKVPIIEGEKASLSPTGAIYLVNGKINTHCLFPFPISFICPFGSINDSTIHQPNNSNHKCEPNENMFSDIECSKYLSGFDSEPNIIAMPTNLCKHDVDIIIFNKINVSDLNDEIYIHFKFGQNRFYINKLFGELSVTSNNIYSKDLGFGFSYDIDDSVDEQKRASVSIDYNIKKDGDILKNGSTVIYPQVPIERDSLTDAYLEIDDILEYIDNIGGGLYKVEFYYTETGTIPCGDTKEFKSFFNIYFYIIKYSDNPSLQYSIEHKVLSLVDLEPAYGLAVINDGDIIDFGDLDNKTYDKIPSTPNLVVYSPDDDSVWNKTSSLFYKTNLGDQVLIDNINVDISDITEYLDKPNISYNVVNDSLTGSVNNFPTLFSDVSLQYSTDGVDWYDVVLSGNEFIIDDIGGVDDIKFRYFYSGSASDVLSISLFAVTHSVGDTEDAFNNDDAGYTLENSDKEHISLSDMVIRTYEPVKGFFARWSFPVKEGYEGIRLYLYGEGIEKLNKYVSFDAGYNIQMDSDEFYFRGERASIQGDFKTVHLTLSSDEEFTGYIRRIFVEWI